MPKKSSEKIEKEKPEVEEKPKKHSKEDYEKKVIELAKTGMTSEKIGETLKREKIFPTEKIKISKILKEKKLYVVPDVKNIEIKLERIKNHFERNKQDKKALKDREKIVGRLRKTTAYFNRNKN